MPAVSTSPVIYSTDAFGITLSRLSVVGGAGKVGKAIQFGALNASAFVGLGITLDRVMITGFDECIRLIFCNQVNIIGGNWLDSNKGIWFGKDTASGWGDATINGLQTIRVADVFTGADGTGCRVSGRNGDFNYFTRIAKVESTGMFEWTNINVEDGTGSVVDLKGSNGSVSLDGITRLRSDIPLVRNFGSSNHVDITGDVSGGGIYRTAGLEYPNFLDRTMTIERYSSTAFTTLLEQEWAASIYRPRSAESSIREYTDNWMRNLDSTAGIVGLMGWTRTNITGSVFNTTDGSLLASPQPGCMSFHSTNVSTVGNSGRLAANYVGYINGTGVNHFQLDFSVWISSTATNSKFRYGLYNISSLTMNPNDGVGVIHDPALSAYLQLEVITGGTATRVPTTLLASSFNTPQAVHVRLQRRGGGIYLALRNHANNAILCPQVTANPTITTQAVAPCFLSEVTTATAFLSIFYPNYSLRFIDAY